MIQPVFGLALNRGGGVFADSTKETSFAHLLNRSLDRIKDQLGVFICVRSGIETVARFADVHALLEHVVVKDICEAKLAWKDEAEQRGKVGDTYRDSRIIEIAV